MGEFSPTTRNGDCEEIANTSPVDAATGTVVIFDSRAETCLVRLGAKLHVKYATYRAAWLKQFDQCELEIQKACAELVRVKDFSPKDETIASLTSTVNSRWFHERVFDKYLWWNGSA
jgi:hypothetical protein